MSTDRPVDTQAFAAAMPFAAVLGVELTSAHAEEIRAKLAWAPERCTGGGVLHGGVIMGFGDVLGAICAFLNLPPGARTATIESKTNFFRAVSSGHVEAIAKPLHVGRRTIVVQTDMFDSTGRRVAQVTQTQAVLAGE
ncbi:MAG: PaaI family thioesterase [Candidatus Methylomirabilia bacterium]